MALQWGKGPFSNLNSHPSSGTPISNSEYAHSQCKESSFIPVPGVTDDLVFVPFWSSRKQKGSEKNYVQKVTSPKEDTSWQELQNLGLLLISFPHQTPGSGKCSNFLPIFVRKFSVYTLFLICIELTQFLTGKPHSDSLNTFHPGKCGLEHLSYPSLSSSSSSL